VYVPRPAPPVEEIPGREHVALPQPRPSYARFWLRAVAFLIDRFILSFIFGLIASFYPTVLMIFPNPNAQPVIAPNHLPLQEFLLSLPHLTSAGFLLLFLMMWIYYAFFEASVAGYAWQESAEAVCHGPHRASDYILARFDSSFW
jgi:hypothetical protein